MCFMKPDPRKKIERKVFNIHKFKLFCKKEIKFALKNSLPILLL